MMKKNIICLFFCVYAINAVFLNAQEFSFPMYFEDAEGNCDTIIIGYDIGGSRDTINPEFGEENIANIPFDSIFDVRITNQADINGASWNYEFELYHSKKKIVSSIDKLVNIDIHAKHWPVTAKWNPELFDNSELNGSLLTPWNEQGWWDSGWYYSNFDRVVLRETEQITFTANYPDNWEENPIDYYDYCYYTDNEGKPIATYWVALADSTLLTLNVDEIINNYKSFIFPNPTNGVLFIENNDKVIKNLIFYDIIGKPYFVSIRDNETDISNLPKGVYFLKIIFSNGETEIHKIIKNQ